MKYAVGMGSGVMIYIPSFIKKSFRNSKINRWNSQTAGRLHKPVLLFFRNKRNRLKSFMRLQARKAESL
jgi:hypothetical protein